MPVLTLHKLGQTWREEIKDGANLVVQTGIKQFPHPHFQYGCGMGKCARCAMRVLAGGEHLAAPNWKEQKMLGERLNAGWRLACQLWIHQDLEVTQEPDAAAGAP